MYRTALALLVLLAVPSATHADMDFIGYAFGKSYTVTVTRADLKKSPDWDESRVENPPLSAQRALKLATGFRKTLVPDPAKWKWELEYIGLRQLYGRWYWLARFEAYPTHAAFSGVAPNLYVAVLMDGTVVKPHIEEDRPYHR